MAMKHSFSVEAAEEVGIVPAVLLDNIAFWCLHNEANGEHFHDGSYWTYNSVKAFSALFPYMKESAIRKALRDLEGAGYLRSGVFNDLPYDRTKWYTVTEAGMELVGVEPLTGEHSKKGLVEKASSICEKMQMGMEKNTNDNCRKIQTNTRYKPNVNQLVPPINTPQVAEIVGHLNERLGTCYSPKTAQTAKLISGRLSEGYSVKDLEDVIDSKADEWEHDPKMSKYLTPSTLFRPSNFEKYLNSMRATGGGRYDFSAYD